jgi:hypothetical protein
MQLRPVLDGSSVDQIPSPATPIRLPLGNVLLVLWPPCGLSPRWPFFDGHTRGMVYSYLYRFDPMTATRPHEDYRPLGALPSHRVIFNAAAPPAPLPSSFASAKPFPHAPFRPAGAAAPQLPQWSSWTGSCRGVWHGGWWESSDDSDSKISKC